MRVMLAKHLGLDEDSVHVISKDVGGSYGVKLHVYGDEIATAAAAKLLGRPVKFVADRLESFLTDIHARCHVARARMCLDGEGRITALEVEDLMEIGAYAAYPRASAHEAYQIINLCGAAYLIDNYRASAKVVFQNKNITSQLRGVGHPVTTTICEGLIDFAAGAANIDPVELRRRNLIPDDAYPRTTATNRHFEGNSHQGCLAKLVQMMDYARLREEQALLRKRNIHRGIGIAAFVESTGPGPTIYGAGGAPVSAQESTTVSLEPSGAILCASGVTEQGQGTNAMLAQVTADAVGVPLESVRVITGDTQRSPCGGGTWGSRGAAIGGEATWKAGRALRANLLALAAPLLQRPASELDIVRGEVVDPAGAKRISLAELARVAYYRSGDLPAGLHPEMRVTRSFRAVGDAHAYTNGMHGAHLELDAETGFVRLLGYWVAEDCGVMVNPLLVDEQIRGGVAMGLGWALLEQCVYGEGQLLNGTMADYLVPMAGDLPDIRIAHLSTPTRASELGIKGAGESGVIAAPGAVLNAVNDALRPFGAQVSQIPVTPRRILEALQNDRNRDLAHS
jgi:carbon-monoxide dehydrogenase large subunit